MDSIYEHNSEGDWYRVDLSLNHHHSLKDYQAYTIINFCVFVNTFYQEMAREMDIG